MLKCVCPTIRFETILFMLSIIMTKNDERPLHGIAINEGKTFPYKNNSCIWMSRTIAFQNCLRIDNLKIRKEVTFQYSVKIF